MVSQVVTTEWRTMNAQKFIETVQNSENFYYVWAGQSVPVSVIPLISPDVIDSSVNIYDNMIFGKVVTATDVALLINNIPYTSNTVYAAYDDGDPVLLTKNYYTVVDTGNGGYKHVFKCLYNNNGGVSTVSPNFADVDIADDSYQTSDGYRWKYMYSIDQTTYTKFTTSSGMVPVVANSVVSSSAIKGSIDVIQVANNGLGYNNYLIGTFGINDLRVNGNTTVYSVTSNTLSSHQNGFYTGCIMYISSGAGIGQNKIITDYYANSSGNFVVVNSEFIYPPMNGSNFEIYPNVVIIGDGNQTVNAVARALINTVGNTVSSIEMLGIGAGYTYTSATVSANAVVGVGVNAVLRPVYPPAGGHGANAAIELGAASVAVSVRFSNTENNTIPTQNGFRQIGLMTDPVFSTATITLNNVDGIFIAGETINPISTILLQNLSSVQGNTVSCNTSSFTQQVSSGDNLFLASSDGLFQALVQVGNVANNTTLNLTGNLSWACTSVTVSLAQVGSSYIVQSFDGINNLTMASIKPDIVVGAFVIGNQSGATANVAAISRSNINKNFSTFVQAESYIGSVTSGVFTQNEIVYQGTSLANSTANAVVHSVNGNTSVTFYATNRVGVFSNTVPIVGSSSGASMNFTQQYPGEIIPRSGNILYAENIPTVNRSNTTSENITIVLDF